MKALPNNLDAETSVLGSCLLSHDAVAIAMDKLTPSDFYHGAHGSIFEAIAALAAEQKPVDIITVTQALQQTGQLQHIGGSVVIASLANAVPTSVNAEYYANIVAEHAQTRRIITAATKIAEKGYQQPQAEEYRSFAEAEIYAATGETGGGEVVAIGDALVNGGLNEILKGSGPKGVDTPWADINHYIPGLIPGDLVVVAARPSMGKTALGIQIADHVATKYGGVYVASLEMSKQQLIKRVVSARSSVSGHYIRTKIMGDAERQMIVNAAKKLHKVPLYIDDSAQLTTAQIRSRAQRIKARKGLQLIVVDYLQLISEKAENRTQEISKISRSLKGIAKALGVPVVALSQLSRAVEQRADKRPMLSDLRESGSIEQDADIVAFIYRDEYYNPETLKQGMAEVIIAKQRDGPTGTVELAWLKEFTRFMSLARSG